jgi:hypothetical protein
LIETNDHGDVVLVDNTLVFLGYLNGTECRHNTLLFPQAGITSATDIRSLFGDHLNGPYGLLSESGQLYSFVTWPDHPDSVYLESQGDASSPTLAHIAIAGNGRTSIIMLQAKASSMIHVLDFINYDAFETWYADLSGAAETGKQKPFGHHMVGGRAVTLLSSATSFILLTGEGTVFSWGDGRHPRCLGRTPSEENPANKPSLVDALGGIKIDRIDSRGWVFGALSDSGDLYLWGRDKPGTDDAVLAHLLDDEVRLVEGEMIEDIKDFAVGNGHIVVANADGEVWTVGENRNGQLGVSTGDETMSTSWRKVASVKPNEVVGVAAGDLTSFLVCREELKTFP